MTRDKAKWMESLIVGDRVILSYVRHDEITTIEKITSTQIVTKHGLRFRRDNGRRIGGHGSYSFVTLAQVTPSREAAIIRATTIGMLTRLEKRDLEHLTNEQLTSFLSLVQNKEAANAG